MRHLSDYFQDYTTVSARVPQSGQDLEIDDEEMQSTRLDAFEEGYKAGWDDAALSGAAVSEQMCQALSQNLQDLSFTYNEASSHVIASIKPLLIQLTGKVLPRIAQEFIGPLVLQTIEDAVRNNARPQVCVTVSESEASHIEKVFEQDFGFPVILASSSELSPGQACIQFENSEQMIDINSVTDRMSELVSDFLSQNERNLKYGT